MTFIMLIFFQNSIGIFQVGVVSLRLFEKKVFILRLITDKELINLVVFQPALFICAVQYIFCAL